MRGQRRGAGHIRKPQLRRGVNPAPQEGLLQGTAAHALTSLALWPRCLRGARAPLPYFARTQLPLPRTLHHVPTPPPEEIPLHLPTTLPIFLQLPPPLHASNHILSEKTLPHPSHEKRTFKARPKDPSPNLPSLLLSHPGNEEREPHILTREKHTQGNPSPLLRNTFSPSTHPPTFPRLGTDPGGCALRLWDCVGRPVT